MTGLKKNLDLSIEIKKQLLDKDDERLSIRKQCELLGLNRSTTYYHSKEISDYTLKLLNIIDEEYTRHPFYGTRRMTEYLKRQGFLINRKRIQRLYNYLGIEATYPKKNLSRRKKEHEVFPYLLKEVNIDHVNQVWSADITYIRMYKGFVYLVAIIDWFSRYVLDWSISISLDTSFCIETLEKALSKTICNIFNTDQGAQFTTPRFTEILIKRGISISMDGRGRALDNIFIERLWRSLKYECVYLQEFRSVMEAEQKIGEWFKFYNNERLHQSLKYKTPQEVYLGN
jgi:putative transposase